MRRLLRIVAFVGLILAPALWSAPQSFAAWQTSVLPAWLQAHVGYGDGQIAPVVLQRARALYAQKWREGVVHNRCYFAMDATRPNDIGTGVGRRFYIICEASHTFRAISAGHGGGRNLPGLANFSNGRVCAKNFGNAMDSKLTAGGAYVTAETKTSFKGYYRVSGGNDGVLIRTFVQFDGEGETANARRREIGGHPAVLIRAMCRMKAPKSPYANPTGYVPFGKLVVYAGGRSNGCTSWSPSDARQITALVQNNPTTLYIYPDAADINAVAHAIAAHQSPARAGLYWNASCLKQIGAPRFWPSQTLEPIIAKYKRDHPAPPPRPLPICKP